MAVASSIVFLLSAVFAVYVVFGYPLLLAGLARRPGRPVRRHFKPTTVTVLMCVYNGERWIRTKLESILALEYPRDLMQVVVVSDGSTDATNDIVLEFTKRGVELILLPRSGKATALNAGIERAHGDILFFTDVRQPLDPGCLTSLVSTLGDAEVGAACGHVYFIGDPQGAHMGLYWRYEKWIRTNQTRLDSILAGTGCVYAMRRELAVAIPPATLLDDSYLPLSAFVRGYRFVMDPEAVAWEYPNSLDSEFRRKVRTLAGIYQLIGFFPNLVRIGSRMSFHFISYKLGRLLVPFALIGMAVSSVWLPRPWSSVALGAQAVFYLLALVEPWLPQALPGRRIASVIRTFVVLMAASLCAVSIFFVPAQKLWKPTEVRQ